MARRLLFAFILRTRSARNVLVGRSVILLPCWAALGACDREPNLEPSEPPSTPPLPPPRASARTVADLQKELADLEADAGVERATDPPPASGDLKSEIDAFTTLDDCVRVRALKDPLLGDAIDALGYDTLTRDACRILQALQRRTTEPCKPIAASGLRARCESYVATLTGNSGFCPLAGEPSKLATREPMCLARASRDERLCAAVDPGERATCRALVLGRIKECAGNEACVRQVQRWKSLAEPTAEHPVVQSKLHVEVEIEGGGSEPTRRAFDFDDLAAAGAVVNVGFDKVRIALGTPKTAIWPDPSSPVAAPTLFLEVSLPSSGAPGASGAKKKGAQPPSLELGPNDWKLDLLLPKIALLSSVGASQTKLEAASFALDSGAPIHVALTSTLHEMGHAYRVKIDIDTLVRDRIGRTDVH